MSRFISIATGLCATIFSLMQWSSFSKKLIPYGIVFVVIALLYGHTANYSYVNFDDDSIILAHVDFFADWQNFSQLWWTDAWLNPTGVFYRPLQNLSFMWDTNLMNSYQIQNYFSQLTSFHCHNLLLYCLSSWLLCYVLIHLFHLRSSLALCLTIFMITNPMFASLAAWIPTRGDLQLIVFALLGLICFDQYLTKQSWWFLILTVICYAGAIFAKEAGGLLPLALLSYYFCGFYPQQKNKPAIFTAKNLSLALLFIAVALGWFYCRSGIFVADAANNIDFTNFIHQLATIPVTIINFFLPLNYSLFDYYQPLQVIGGTIIIIVGSGYLIFYRPKNLKQIIFGASWFLLFVTPALLFKIDTIEKLYDYLEHRNFLPLIGIVIIAAALLKQAWPQKSWHHWTRFQQTLTILLSLIVISNTYYSWQRSLVFANPWTFWQTASEYQPTRASLVQLHRVYTYLEKYDQVLSVSQQLIDRYATPQTLYADYNERGIIKVKLNDYQGALDDFYLALESTAAATKQVDIQPIINNINQTKEKLTLQ